MKLLELLSSRHGRMAAPRAAVMTAPVLKEMREGARLTNALAGPTLGGRGWVRGRAGG
jgi:hypothetical protein